MRKMIVILLVAAFCLPVFNTVAWADGFVLPEMLGAAVRYHHVSVQIEDNHAVTRVEQEFYNPYTEPISGRYLFPIPPQAMLTDFRATVDGVAQAATRQDAATTNAVLYGGVVNQQNPTLLQYADWESMAFDMTLPPGGARTMVLEYEEVMIPQSGLYHYRYILSTEQYSAVPVEDITLTVNLQSSAGLGTLYSPSHVATTQRNGPGQAMVTWSAQYVQPKENFDLFFSPAEGGAGGWTLGSKPATELYSSTRLIDLTPEQDDLVYRVAENVFRPCCGNSTAFPDCNHRMAVLGLLELMASQGATEDELYQAALTFNAYAFSDTYISLAAYFAIQDIPWSDVNVREVLGPDYSGIQGARRIAAAVGPIPSAPVQGGSCGA
jgi:hypothetical protein